MGGINGPAYSEPGYKNISQEPLRACARHDRIGTHPWRCAWQLCVCPDRASGSRKVSCLTSSATTRRKTPARFRSSPSRCLSKARPDTGKLITAPGLLERIARCSLAIRRTKPFGTLGVFSEAITGDGSAIFRHACGLDLEGIVSKRTGSPYVSGRTGGMAEDSKLELRAAMKRG